MKKPTGIRKFTDDQEKQICRIYFSDQLSTRQLAKQFGCVDNTIWKLIQRQGFKPRTPSEAKAGELNGRWRGGRMRVPSGYIRIYKSNHPLAWNNFVLEHRLVMEKHLRRYLTLAEVVHHINGIPDDNRIENLLLFKNNGEHRIWHVKQKRETELLKENFLIERK